MLAIGRVSVDLRICSVSGDALIPVAKPIAVGLLTTSRSSCRRTWHAEGDDDDEDGDFDEEDDEEDSDEDDEAEKKDRPKRKRHVPLLPAS